jgi:parallel beta-helix repeat protein
LEEIEMRARNIVFKILLSLILCHGLFAQKSYFVSPLGNNSNDGSFGKPWQTVNYGLGKIFPGDTLELMEGIYREVVTNFTRSGQENALITVRQYKNEKAIINGDGKWTVIDFTGRSYYHFKGLEMTNAVWAGFCGTNYHHCIISDCVIHGIGPSSGTAVGIYVSPTSGVADSSTYNVIERNTIYDCFGEGIYVGKDAHGLPPNGSSCNHNIIRYNDVYRCVEGIELKSGSKYNQVVGNKVHNGNGGEYSAGIIAYEHTLIDSNQIHHNSNDGIFIQGNFNRITRNTIYKNGHYGILVSGDQSSWNNYKDSGDDNFIANNTIVLNASWGVYLWGNATYDSRNTVLKNNLLIDNTEYQLVVSSNATAGLVLDSNDWYSGSGSMINYKWQDITTQEGLDQAYGSNANSLMYDPLFVGVDADDYSLQNTSPIIDRGVPAGLPYRGGSPDLGAFEYMPVYFPLNDGSEIAPKPVLFASLSLQNTSSFRRQSYRITMNISSSVVAIPSPLILKESDGSETLIRIQGSIPGRQFFGDLIQDETFAEGLATFSLQENSMVDAEGNRGSDIEGLKTFRVDQTSPPPPRDLRMK